MASRTAKKSKARKKKYNPDVSMKQHKEAWLRSVWLSDSTLHREVVVHNENRIRGHHTSLPKELLFQWGDRLNETFYNWRIIFFGFDLEKEEIHPFIFSIPKRVTVQELGETLKADVELYLGKCKGQIDSWGWAATPSTDVNLSKMEDFYIEYFQMIGLNDKSKVTTRKEFFSDNPNATMEQFNKDVLGIRNNLTNT